MMKKYSAVLIFMLLMYHTKGQLSFSYAYVGCVIPENVINSNDNGFIAFGSTGIMNLDSVGNVIWSKSSSETLNHITCTKDSCYIATGNSFNNIIPFVKFDSAGDTVWCRGVSVSQASNVSSIIESSDSSILISGIQVDTAGPPYHKIFILKLDKNGTFLWMKTYLSANFDNAVYEIVEGPDFNFYAFGWVEYQTTTFYRRATLMCLNTNGDLIWNKIYTDSLNQSLTLLDIQFVNSGILSYFSSNTGAIVSKLDSIGVPLWSNQYSFRAYSNGYSNSKRICKRTENEYYLTTDDSPSIFEMDSVGQIFNSYVTSYQIPTDIFNVTPDSQFAYIGFGFGPPVLVRYDSLIGSMCVNPSVTNQPYISNSLIEDSVVFTVGSDGIVMNHSVQLVSCQAFFYQDCPFLENVNEVAIESSVTIYPNPSSGTVSLIFKDNYTPNSIDFLNITGELIKSFNYSDFYSGSVNLPDMPDGIYLLKFRSDQGISVKKICIQKS